MSALTKFAEFLAASQRGSDPPHWDLPEEQRGERLRLLRGAVAVATSNHILWNGTATITAGGRRLYASTDFH